jgi:hypothetical protein
MYVCMYALYADGWVHNFKNFFTQVLKFKQPHYNQVEHGV